MVNMLLNVYTTQSDILKTTIIRHSYCKLQGCPSPQANDAYCVFPLFHKIHKFPPISAKFINSLTIFPQIYKFPTIFVQFMFFACVGLLLPPILTMMHLRIMLYKYWTPLASFTETVIVIPCKSQQDIC